ncbi:hypothetical protein [Actinomadura atramentaria]|uniref:hypothetical protein n=1 Tax=Actinomadura atramentaria TaxID=1990 RepID=UPI0003786ED2|nr:hypothetical protein [Actinomadura atramentaria]
MSTSTSELPPDPGPLHETVAVPAPFPAPVSAGTPVAGPAPAVFPGSIADSALRAGDGRNHHGTVPEMPSGLIHTTVLATDITAFGDRRRDDETHRHLRAIMYTLMSEAFAMTDLPWWRSVRDDRGDGTLIITPPGIPPALFLDPLAHHLTALLRRTNRTANDVGRLRLRLAVSAGHIQHDGGGFIGRPLIHLFRLLDAPAFKDAFADAGTDLAMIVSEEFYDSALATGGLINPAAYRPLHVASKETHCTAQLWLPATRS